jgi:hypothetical protein
MEQRRDVDNMIGKIDTGLQYVKIIGHLTFLIPLLRRATLNKHFQRLNLLPDTLERFMKVRVQQLSPGVVLYWISMLT